MKKRPWSIVVLGAMTAACQHNGATPAGTGDAAAVVAAEPAPASAAVDRPRPTATAASATAPAPASGQKPNIVFVLADDFSSNLVQFMPNVLAMQKEGVTFSNYFVTDSLCCPSRSSIFTGKLPHDTGVVTNVNGPTGGYAAFVSHGNDAHTFAAALQQAGYQTAMMGKYLNGYEPERNPIPPGWTEWDVAGNGYAEFNYALNENGKVVSYGQDPKDYLTDVVAGLAQAFLHKAKTPFFLETATFAPHGSKLDFPPATPAPRDANLFPGLQAPHTAAFAARPDEDAPSWLKRVPAMLPAKQQHMNDFFRKRAQSVQAIDKMLGEIRATLAAAGETNTYVVFSSDNGLHLGDYSLVPGKQTAYDIDIHVPLIVVGPGVPRGKTVSQLTSNIDLCPTFAELGQAPSGVTQFDGHSLVALLRGESPGEWRRTVLVEHTRPDYSAQDPDGAQGHVGNPPNYAALRTEGALYVEYQDDVEYHDLAKDPDELHNTVKSLPPATKQKLHEILHANVSCKGAESCWAAQRLAP